MENNEYFVSTINELGQIISYDKTYISKLIKAGAPGWNEKEKGYSATRWVKFLLDRVKEKKTASDPARAAMIKFREERARLIELERKILEGKLVDRRECHEAEKARLTEYRQALRGLGAKVSAQCVGKSAAEIQAIVDIEYRRMTQVFVDQINDRQTKNKKAGRPKKIEKAIKG